MPEAPTPERTDLQNTLPVDDLDQASKDPPRWAAVISIAAKIGCTAQTLHGWVKKAEVDSGQRAGVPTDTAEKLKARLFCDGGA